MYVEFLNIRCVFNNCNLLLAFVFIKKCPQKQHQEGEHNRKQYGHKANFHIIVLGVAQALGDKLCNIFCTSDIKF